MLRYGAGDAGDALRASYGTGNPAAEPGSMTHYEDVNPFLLSTFGFNTDIL